MEKIKKLKMTGYYPCPWDDLIDENKKAYATIHTLKSVKKDPLLKLKKEGITFDKQNKIYDVEVFDKPRTLVRGTLRASKSPEQTSAFKPRYSQGLFDVVIDVQELTEKIVRDSLKKLSEITRLTYRLGKTRKRYISVDV